MEDGKDWTQNLSHKVGQELIAEYFKISSYFIVFILLLCCIIAQLEDSANMKILSEILG